MKKIIFVVMLVTGISVSAWAQHKSLGITGGVGSAWMNHTGEDDLDYKVSTNIGLTYVYSTEQHWGFSGDIKYSREGFAYTYTAFGEDVHVRLKSDYIRVPLRVIYFFSDYGKSIRPKISAGPTLGFLTGAKVTAEDEDGNTTEDYVTNDFHVFDFGVNLAVGANFRLAEDTWLSADVAFYQGFLTQNKNGSNNLTNANVALNLGLTMGIGK